MADKRLTEDLPAAEQLKDRMVVLRESQEWQLVSEVFSGKLSLAQRSLEAATDPVELYRSQGRLQAYRDSLKVVDGLIEKISNELESHRVKGASPNDRHGSGYTRFAGL